MAIFNNYPAQGLCIRQLCPFPARKICAFFGLDVPSPEDHNRASVPRAVARTH